MSLMLKQVTCAGLQSALRLNIVLWDHEAVIEMVTALILSRNRRKNDTVIY